jgi:hypothetical protein
VTHLTDADSAPILQACIVNFVTKAENSASIMHATFGVTCRCNQFISKPNYGYKNSPGIDPKCPLSTEHNNHGDLVIFYPTLLSFSEGILRLLSV